MKLSIRRSSAVRLVNHNFNRPSIVLWTYFDVPLYVPLGGLSVHVDVQVRSGPGETKKLLLGIKLGPVQTPKISRPGLIFGVWTGLSTLIWDLSALVEVLKRTC